MLLFTHGCRRSRWWWEWAVGWMTIARGNESTQGKPSTKPLYGPEIADCPATYRLSHDEAAVRISWLFLLTAAWTVASPAALPWRWRPRSAIRGQGRHERTSSCRSLEKRHFVLWGTFAWLRCQSYGAQIRWARGTSNACCVPSKRAGPSETYHARSNEQLRNIHQSSTGYKPWLNQSNWVGDDTSSGINDNPD
jgi:hypothetical protein